MISFLLCLAILIVGYFVYGKICLLYTSNGPQKHKAQHGQHTDRDQSRQQEQGEIAVGLFLDVYKRQELYGIKNIFGQIQRS